MISSPAFRLAPGEARTFDIALLFKQGADRLASVALLQEASDAVQFRYDQDRLFEPAPPIPAPGLLDTPTLLGPEDGTLFVEVGAPLAWTAVPKAEGYRVEIASDPNFSDRRVLFSEEPNLSATCDTFNEVATCYWRVKAVDGFSTSLYSESRSFQSYFYASDNFGQSVGIIEVANPDGAVCPDADDPGCAADYPGNTVWLSPNATDDYVLTNPDNSLGDLFRNIEAVDDDNFEMRFTEACATDGACLGVYSANVPGGNDLIASVPFELWNVGTEDDPNDDVRMIPILRPLDNTEPSAQWADVFPAEQAVIAGTDTLALPVTQRVLWTMPARPDGYDLFAAAANTFGGAGAIYDPETDGDTQVDPGPGDEDCRSQNYYVDFCYRGASNRFVAPIGGLEGTVLADLAGDGTTPPVGTVIRFDSNERLLTDGEAEAPAQPAGFALGAAYPNPFSASATVPFELQHAGTVRLSVVDVLGREVAVLADSEMPAGAHRATLGGARLASGVYLVVLEADGRRQATKVLLLR
ncbi:MAG: T9SS type A sorting domain-containing protein [Bacteroidota bacterium]